MRAEGVEAGNPIPRKVGDPSPIKHCIYIIKENRTYDQVFGDMKEGNGDPDLCLFPEKITPNHHKLAREFVLLDNFYVDGEVSADGHEWTMGAYATDFVEKVWPLSYRGSAKNFGYPSEGATRRDRAAQRRLPLGPVHEAKVSYRSYGEWIENGKKKADGTSRTASRDGQGARRALRSAVPRLRPRLSRREAGRALHRRIEALRGGRRHAAAAVLRLPNDHTSGTRVGKPTPTAMVADNDLALGMVVEAVSKSKFWKETAIFVIEDDAQNGPDHVDAHRVGGAGHLALHEAEVRRFDDVLDDEHAADDGTDPGAEADEPVRRGGPADVQLVHREADLTPTSTRCRRST